MSYSSGGNRPKLTEKGLLMRDNCVRRLPKRCQVTTTSS